MNFNPRSREGSDLSFTGPFRGHANFNPRSREGSDTLAIIFMWLVIDISIHAPARGATMDNDAIAQKVIISIHAPARGATPKLTNFYPK